MIAIGDISRDFGPEIGAIVLACRVYVGTATADELNDYIQRHELNYDRLYTIGRLHQLRPILYSALHKAAIPQATKDQLQADCKAIALRNLEHIGETTRVCDELSKINVLAVPYKGGVFARRYYKDAGAREFSDMDFLVQQDVTVLDKLKSAFGPWGYTDKSDIPEGFKDTYFKYAREYNFDKRDGDRRRFHAEFHWFAASQVFDFPTPLPNSLLFTGLKETELFGKKIKLLSDTHHFMTIVAHHGLNQRWALMKYAMDLAMILKNGELDWNEIDAVSKKYGFSKATNIGLRVAGTLLGIKPAYDHPVPAGVDAYLKELLGSLNKDRKSTSDTLLLNLEIKDNAAHKMKMVAKYLRYATVPSILDYQFLRLPKSLFFLYAIVKPVRLIISGNEKK